jgi:glycosyltransferase involved in cell wall biosynthesis
MLQLRDIDYLAYISQGNIPSRKAHTTQACHMAAALAAHVPRVELITQAQIRRGRHVQATKDVSAWYGLPDELTIRRLPVSARSICDDQGFIQRVPKRFARYAALYCRFRRPQLVYTRLLKAAVQTCRMRLPTVLETHDPPANEASLFAKVVAQAQTPWFRGLVTVSPVLGQIFADHGIPQEKILVSPDAANTTPFDHANAQLGDRSGSDRLVVGYCGHFYPGRGIETLLECGRRLPEIEFRLIGGYPEDVERYKSISADLPNVHYVGFVPNSEVPRRLVECDILCMPYTEACPIIDWISPMKMFEYMAAGRAILASNLTAMREVLEHERNSLLCSADSPASWVEAIQRLARDQTLRMQLGRQARKEVSQYTWTGRAGEVLDWLTTTDLCKAA